jgi:predicted membrane protein
MILIKIIVTIFKIINNFLKFLYLRLLAVFCLLALIAESSFHIISKYPFAEIVFYVILGILIIRWGYLCISTKELRKELEEKRERRKREKAEKAEKPEREEPVQINVPVPEKNSFSSNTDKQIAYPVYYNVSQNANYVMAEYADRYKLYYRTKNGLKYIRTDYKN